MRAEPSRLVVHGLAAGLVTDIVRLSITFRGPAAAARADQLTRAALSISSNIAEACGRGTVPEFRRFLLYACGSAQETLSQLRVARSLDESRRGNILRLENQVVLVIKMISRLHDNPPPDR